MLFGYINFFICVFKNKKSICNLNILIPQVVEPAQPPINIKKRKKINGNFPHNPKSSVTYPVPDKIDSTLNDEILKLSKKDNSLLEMNKYKNIIKIDIISK